MLGRSISVGNGTDVGRWERRERVKLARAAKNARIHGHRDRLHLCCEKQLKFTCRSVIFFRVPPRFWVCPWAVRPDHRRLASGISTTIPASGGTATNSVVVFSPASASPTAGDGDGEGDDGGDGNDDANGSEACEDVVERIEAACESLVAGVA